LYDIDTRALTKIVREYGVMNASISFQPNISDIIPKLKAYKINDAVNQVSCKEPYSEQAEPENFRVVLWTSVQKQTSAVSLLNMDAVSLRFPHLQVQRISFL
jgi:carbamoyl-phosphate synthase small subunit